MFVETVSIWSYLSETEKPIIVYGMGDGADKILAVFDKYNINVSGFTASDEFVRGHSFKGFPVQSFSDIERQFADFIIVVAFGTARPEVLDKLYRISETYEVFAPDVPVYGDVLSDLWNESFVAENAKRIETVRKFFADKQSEQVFDNLVDYKISGKISYLREIATPKSEEAELLGIKNNGSETFVDVGAYTGDTAEEFLRITDKNFNKIFAFEPDTRNYMKMRRRLYQLGSAKFIPINAAAWDDDGETDFSSLGGRNSTASSKKANARPVKTRTINSVCKGEKVTLIKFDAEGSEAKALIGSSDIIKNCKPRLIVSVYHRSCDLLDLPLLIKKLDGRYKFYLRHNECIPAWDTNLYCI